QLPMISGRKCNPVFLPSPLEVREIAAMICWLSRALEPCTRMCVRQAAGHDRLAACAPRNFLARGVPPPRKQWQWTAWFLARGCSQSDVDAQRLEPTAQQVVMLLGQDLCRRHECGLISSFNRKQHRRDGNDGFSRANVSL